jgi:hypothetical protein
MTRPAPFGLSLSKPSPLLLPWREEEKAFDRLRPNGGPGNG